MCVEKERERVETTRGRDPAVSTEAFPLNSVPLCNRQCQFRARAWGGRDGSRAQPVATSTLGPPYVLFMNSRTHTLYKLYTLKPSKSPHTQGLRPGRLRTFWLYYSASAGNHHSVILIFLLYTSVKMQHVSTLFKPPVRCDPRAQNLLITSNYSKHPIIGRGVRTRLQRGKKRFPSASVWGVGQ